MIRKFVIFVMFVCTSCNHAEKSTRNLRPAPTVATTAPKMEASNREIVNEQRRTANPNFALSDNTQLGALVDILVLQKKIQIKDYDGRSFNVADYRLNPSQYFMLISEGPSSASYFVLNTTIRPLSNSPSKFEISHKFFKLKGDMENFEGAHLTAPIFTKNVQLTTNEREMLKNIPAIADLIQDIETHQHFAENAGQFKSIFDGLSDFLVPSAYAGTKRGYLVSGIVFSSISVIAFYQSKTSLGSVTLLAGISLLFLDWLNRPNDILDNPVALPEKHSPAIDHDDQISKNCSSYSQEVSPAQLAAYAPHMASLEHRFYHLIWHGLRNSWHDLTAEEVAVINAIDPRYAVHRPISAPGVTRQADPLKDPLRNGAGEDFLRMHRDMVLMVRQALVAKGLPCIASWRTTPALTDPLYSSFLAYKSGTKTKLAFEIMKMLQRRYFHNQKWLASEPLSSVAHTLEFTLHGLFHLRFADETDKFKSRPLFTIANLETYPKSMAAVENQYLADPFSSHVNPVFWKLHGFVDEVVGHWLAAHGYTSVARDCAGKPKCYQWQTGAETYSLPHMDMMQVLPNFIKFVKANPQKANTLSTILQKIEANKLRIFGSFSTYPDITDKTLYTMDRLGVNANFAVRVGDLIIMP
ncbi:MAG: hypothetical protein NT027_03975 [Proteobacteria bacterium]|nr:hypothetical protein [Pseudomonadota bacterium]